MITFNESKVSNDIPNKDGIVNYYGKILSSVVANQYFDLLMQNIHWEKDQVIIFDKNITTKRKVAWYGDSEYLYTYSSTTKWALAWTKDLFELKQIVEKYAETKFNSCLLNLYHNGNEGMGWHSDDEKTTRKEQYYCFVELWSRTKILIQA